MTLKIRVNVITDVHEGETACQCVQCGAPGVCRFAKFIGGPLVGEANWAKGHSLFVLVEFQGVCSLF